MIQRASQVNQSHLENSNEGRPPQLSEAEKADTQAFLREMLQILPLIGLICFEIPKAIVPPDRPPVSTDEPDTIVVPAQQGGFQRTFLGKNAWNAVRISGGMLPKIKYIAAYQTQPVSAVTHLAPVARIEPYGDTGKYQLVFSEPAKEIGPIPLGKMPSGAMQGPRYTTLTKLQSAKTVVDLLAKE